MRQAIELFLLTKQTEELPEEWLIYWEAMERGLKLCWPLRRAMFDIQIAKMERRLPALPILSLDEACGVAGMLLGTPNYYRVKPRRGKEPKTREEYEVAASSSQKILTFPLAVLYIEQYMQGIRESAGTMLSLP